MLMINLVIPFNADLLTVMSDGTVRALNISVIPQTVCLVISNNFERVRLAGLLGKLKSYGISG